MSSIHLPPLLILDLDETLFHASETTLNHSPDFVFDSYFAYKRPVLDQFLNEIKNTYGVAVWSSASKPYVDEVVKHLFPSDYDLKFVWSRERCTVKSRKGVNLLETADIHYHNSSGIITKQLKKVKKKGYTLERLLIVEDTPSKVMDNYGNAVYVNPYFGEKDDHELLHLLDYLLKISSCSNFRRLEKRFWRNENF